MSTHSSSSRRWTSAYSLDNEDDAEMSSTSTAGPPPPDLPQTTGRFTRPTWAFPSPGSQGSSLTSSYNIKASQSNQTGSFPRNMNSSMGTGNLARRGSHNRTLSTTSASLSPTPGMSQEWGGSFRLFSTARYFGIPNTSQHKSREDNLHQSIFRSSFFGNHQLRPGGGQRALEGSHYYPRQSSVFSYCSGQNGGGTQTHFQSSTNNYNSSISSPGFPQSPELRGTSFVFSAGSPVPLNSINLSSFAGPNRQGGSGGNGGAPLHYYVYATKFSAASYSSAQKQLPLLLNTLRTHMALTGKTITVGDAEHPMEIVRGPIIGFGGFASVFAGVNTVRAELLAIKEIDITGVNDVKALNAIEEEFGLLKSLRHPNIVKYHFFEHSRSQKVCRIVMELLAGDSTLHLLQKFGPLTESILRNITRHLLNAISFIHREGIFHRDIKPANILLSHRGEVKLCDFGCSKRVSELNKASSCILGTPVYMSPEMIKGEGDHKSDIWSMGCSLFELATGFQPWYHSGLRDHLKLMFYITTTSETPLVIPAQDNVADFSPEFVSFLEACFTRNVDKRPEAAALLNHPWMTGAAPLASAGTDAPRGLRTPPPSPFHLVEGGGREATLSPRSNTIEASLNSSHMSTETALLRHASVIETEVFCVQELEEITAAIAADLCSSLINADKYATKQDSQTAEEGAAAAAASFENSAQLTRSVSEHSSQKHSVAASPQPQQQQQCSPPQSQSPTMLQQLPASMSLGDFTLPAGTPEHSIVNDNFQFNQVTLGASAGNFVLPSELSEQPTQQFLRINEDGNLDLTTLPEDPVAISDAGASSAEHASRLTSPCRTNAAARDLPLMSTSTRSGLPSPPSSSRGGDSSVASPQSLSTSMSFRPLPDNAKPQQDGKLHLSLAVTDDVNIELNVDVSDVHCKVVDNRPNYVVAFTDDIRGQIASKIKAVSAQQQPLSLRETSSESFGAAVPSPPIGGGSDSPISYARRSSGSHFYNSPSFLSASRSPRRQMSRHSIGSSQFPTSVSTQLNTPVGDPLSPSGASAAGSSAFHNSGSAGNTSAVTNTTTTANDNRASGSNETGDSDGANAINTTITTAANPINNNSSGVHVTSILSPRLSPRTSNSNSTKP